MTNTFLSPGLLVGFAFVALVGVSVAVLMANRESLLGRVSSRRGVWFFPAPRAGSETQIESKKIASVPSGSVLSDFASSAFERKSQGGAYAKQCLIASLRGASHAEAGKPRQDSFATFVSGAWSAFVLLDGVSSAEESHLGSSFLAQSFERFFSGSFPEGPSHDLTAWSELRASLSQHLVSMHSSIEKRAGREVTQDIQSLRLEAMKKFATTLEVLFVELPRDEDGFAEYIFVRLAGDGSLVKLAGNSFELLTPSSDNSNYPKPPVGALPAFDGEVSLVAGKLLPHETVIIFTDGMGDHLLSCESIKARFGSIGMDATLTHETAIHILESECQDARDDRTFAMVRVV
jgi:hypothetical protein